MAKPTVGTFWFGASAWHLLQLNSQRNTYSLKEGKLEGAVTEDLRPSLSFQLHVTISDMPQTWPRKLAELGNWINSEWIKCSMKLPPQLQFPCHYFLAPATNECTFFNRVFSDILCGLYLEGFDRDSMLLTRNAGVGKLNYVIQPLMETCTNWCSYFP